MTPKDAAYDCIQLCILCTNLEYTGRRRLTKPSFVYYYPERAAACATRTLSFFGSCAQGLVVLRRYCTLQAILPEPGKWIERLLCPYMSWRQNIFYQMGIRALVSWGQQHTCPQ